MKPDRKTAFITVQDTPCLMNDAECIGILNTTTGEHGGCIWRQGLVDSDVYWIAYNATSGIVALACREHHEGVDGLLVSTIMSLNTWALGYLLFADELATRSWNDALPHPVTELGVKSDSVLAQSGINFDPGVFEPFGDLTHVSMIPGWHVTAVLLPMSPGPLT